MDLVVKSELVEHWLGLDSRDQFDPARFDPAEANQRLATASSRR